MFIRKIKSVRTRFTLWITSTRRSLISKLVVLLTQQLWLIDHLPIRATPKEQTLLVRLDLIGDFIIWLDSASAYRDLYPNHKIVLLANSVWASLAQPLDYWDEVIAVDVPRLRFDDWFRLKWLIRVRIRGFAVAIQPTYSREFVADLCVRASKAPFRLGHLGDLSNITLAKKAISDAWYTRLVDLRDQPELELNLNAAFVRSLGYHAFRSSLPALHYRTELSEQLSITEPYYVIAPGASWPPKMWSAEKFASLAKHINKIYGLKLVLCGTLAERSICEEVERTSGIELINLAGRTTLPEMVELIRRAKLLVANDSAAVHIAIANKTNAVGIVGGGHFGRFLPYSPEQSASGGLSEVIVERMDCFGCNWRCKYLDTNTTVVPCISKINVSSVVAACDRALGMSSESP